MNKDQRQKAWNEGKTIIRPQWSERYNAWMIKRYSITGGWKLYSANTFSSLQECEAIVDVLVRDHLDIIKDFGTLPEPAAPSPPG